MRKLFKKKLGISGLTCAMVLSAVGGLCYANVPVLADDATNVATTALAESSKATISVADGLKIASETNYKAAINGVFEGDTTISFAFPDDGSGGRSGDFKFRITDAEDESVYFDVEYSLVGLWNDPSGAVFAYTGAHVNYQGNYRSTNCWNAASWYNSRQTVADTVYCGPGFMGRYDWGNTCPGGTLVLDYDDNGVLAVKVSQASNPADTRSIAKFDGTDEFVSGTSWGLPEMPFENGYTISMVSDYANGTDALFTSITTDETTYDLTQETMAKPAFYTRWEELSAGAEEVESVATTLLAESTKATVTANNGLKIASEGKYDATLKGVFNGDTTIKFSFPADEAGGINGDFKFRITDALDPDVYFDVEYSLVGVWETFAYTGAHVNYQGNYRSSLYWNPAQMYNSRQTGADTVYCGPSFMGRYDWGTACPGGTFILDYNEDGLLVVGVSSAGDPNVLRPIAVFDGTDEFVNGTSWGLPEMPFENGYTISMISDYANGTDALFKSITTDNLTYDLTEATVEKPAFLTRWENRAPVVEKVDIKKEIAKTIVAQNATATWGEDAKGNEGMKIEAEKGSSFTAQIPGYMQGNTTMKFAFPSAGSAWNESENWNSVSFVVSDLNGEEVFRVRYMVTGGWYTRAEVIYGTEYRTHSSELYNWGPGYVFNEGYLRQDDQDMAPGLSVSAHIAADMQIKITDDIVSVWAYDSKAGRMYEIAAFDGTSVVYEGMGADGKLIVPEASFQGYNLPKVYDRIKDGYSIGIETNSPNIDADTTIISVDTAKYFNTITYGTETQNVDFKSEVTLAAAPQLEEGQVFLGWKNTATGGLYRAGEKVTVTANMSFEAVVITFNMYGASLRIDTVGGTSGLRFITTYNLEEVMAVMSYFKSYGTIIAKTASLDGIDFVIENFTVGTDLAMIENTKEHFAMGDAMAFSAALTNIKASNIDQEFSARAYIELVYHDGSTGYVYSDYSAENNSRSVQGVAQALKEYLGGGYYNSLSDEAKAVIDAYAE